MNDIILEKDDKSWLRINPAKTIFWTGAGISCIPPSSLPLGNELTDAYLETALGSKWKDFVALWNNNFPQIMNSVRNGKFFFPEKIGKFTSKEVDKMEARARPRLEYIIGEMDKMDKYFNAIHFNKASNKRLFSRESSLAALNKFAMVKPCIYHYRLADLAKAGAVMITANFDTGIENALGVDATKVERKYNTPAIYNGYGNYIFHFHGVATDDPNNFGATINNMSKGLDEDFENHIKSLFENGYNVVFVGYGGVDFFDVEPFFRGLDKGNYTGKAIYLQYCNGVKDAEDKRKERDKTYDYLLKPFQNQCVVYGDTEDFFQALFGVYSSITTLNIDCGAFKATKDELKKIVKEQINEETYYFLNMFRLCSQLNINPGRFYPNWVNRIREIFDVWEKDGTNTLKNMTVIRGQKNDGIIDDIYSNNWHDAELFATGMTDKLRPYIKEWDIKHKTIMLKANQAFWFLGIPLPKHIIQHNVDKTEEILRNKRVDDHSSDISRGTVMYLCGNQTKIAILLYMASRGLIKCRLLFLKDCIERLLQYPFTRFRYRTHYLSLCRQMAYINATLHKGQNGFEGDIQKEWDICMQTPILYEAGQVLNCRLIQAKLYGLSDGTKELKMIRERILDLRKAK